MALGPYYLCQVKFIFHLEPDSLWTWYYQGITPPIEKLSHATTYWTSYMGPRLILKNALKRVLTLWMQLTPTPLRRQIICGWWQKVHGCDQALFPWQPSNLTLGGCNHLCRLYVVVPKVLRTKHHSVRFCFLTVCRYSICESNLHFSSIIPFSISWTLYTIILCIHWWGAHNFSIQLCAVYNVHDSIAWTVIWLWAFKSTLWNGRKLHDSEKVYTLMGEYLKPGSGRLN